MKKENNAIVITSIIGGVILIIAIATLLTLGSVGGSKNKVTVQGISTIKAIPDLITVYYSIETIGETAVEAKNTENIIYEKLAFSLIALGFNKNEIQTQTYNIYPNYEWKNGKQTQNGYKAYHSIKLELSVDNSNLISDTIDSGVYSGAGISYINFELTQESQNKYKSEALELAAQDAKVKADAVASGFGKKAGKLISVSVSDFGYYLWNLYTAKSESGYSDNDIASAREIALGITPSEQEIMAMVSATFRIK